MATIPVEKELLEDLLNSKLKQITQKINAMLEKWQYSSIELFLQDASNGKIQEAEMDAISLTNLIDRREELLQHKAKWSAIY